MDSVVSLLEILEKRKPIVAPRATERGELLREMARKMHYFKKDGTEDLARMAGRVVKLNLQDLYYIKSVCDDAVRREEKKNWGHAFNSLMYMRK